MQHLREFWPVDLAPAFHLREPGQYNGTPCSRKLRDLPPQRFQPLGHLRPDEEAPGVPGVSALRRHYRIYLASCGDIVAHKPRQPRVLKKCRAVCPEGLAATYDQIRKALTPETRGKSAPARAVIEGMRVLNEQRRAEGLPGFYVYSERQIQRMIADLSPFEVCCAQEGSDKARHKFSSYLSGVSPVCLLERVEIDDWEADVMIWFRYLGLGEQPYEVVLLTTATPVLEGRVIKIWRNMRQPNADLPDPAELIAQLEALYGPLSWVGPDPIGARMVKYVWTPSGQLARQPEEPCSGPNYRGYSFDNDREPVAPPECSAVFTMTYETEAGQSTVLFSLIDFDLARQDLAETDRQILEQISDEGVQPFDMKL